MATGRDHQSRVGRSHGREIARATIRNHLFEQWFLGDPYLLAESIIRVGAYEIRTRLRKDQATNRLKVVTTESLLGGNPTGEVIFGSSGQHSLGVQNVTFDDEEDITSGYVFNVRVSGA